MARRKKQPKKRAVSSRPHSKSKRKSSRKRVDPKRSRAAKRAAATRKLNKRLAAEGIVLDRAWQGKGRDKQPTGYHYERYRLETLDPEIVDNILREVKRKHKGESFFVGGQIDFRDESNRLFTNNSAMTTDEDENAAELIVEGLAEKEEHNSNPFLQKGKSREVDIEGYFVVIRFARFRHKVKNGKPKKRTGKKRPVKRKSTSRKPQRKRKPISKRKSRNKTR